jgi:hypothetical protein
MPLSCTPPLDPPARHRVAGYHRLPAVLDVHLLVDVRHGYVLRSNKSGHGRPSSTGIEGRAPRRSAHVLITA